MGRQPNPIATDKMSIVVNEIQVEYFDQMVRLGFASTIHGAALYVVQRGIDDMMRAGILTARRNQ